MRYEREGVKADSARLEAGSGGGLVHLFAFFVMKNRRERNSYLASAAKHEKIVEALTRLSAAKPRVLMRDSLSCWRTEILDELLPGESK